MKQALIDQVEFRVRAGNGGAGSVHFLRNKISPKGGPDGGDGGNGGSIFLVANSNMTTLLDYAGKDHFEALFGERGSGQNKHGKDAEDLFLDVPVGTEIYVRMDEEGTPSKDGEWSKQFDLTTPGEKVLLARGGAGGRGNTAFKSSSNTTPMQAEGGQWGEEKFVKLEMKILADVGLVGFPNAGKSTLLSVLTAARPEIANYPFTTISPNLGVMETVGESLRKQLIIADIPGLIEDAHKGKGLGTDFLRHIERCRMLVYVISPTDENLMIEDPHELATLLGKQFEAVRKEVVSYGHDVDQKLRLVVINKIDVMSEETLTAIKAEFADETVEFVSAATLQGIDLLKQRLLS